MTDTISGLKNSPTPKRVIEELANSRIFREGSPFSMRVEHHNPKVCVITGDNCSGKSLARKVLHNIFHDAGIHYMHYSQQSRSTSGIARAFVYGGSEDYDSTGYISVHSLTRGLKQAATPGKPVALLFDEPEIGCGEEIQFAVGAELAQAWKRIPELFCMYVVTHSRHVASALLCSNPTHIRLGDDRYASLGDWVRRPAPGYHDWKPDTLQALVATGKKHYSDVQDIINRRKTDDAR